jgi:hypothetical protein
MTMIEEVVQTSPGAARLRRLGRVPRRRMRIDGDALRNGRHTDGRLTVEISGLGSAAAGVPESFGWRADRPMALVIVRSGIDGDDVNFLVGPAVAGQGRSVGVGDGSGIRYVAFCYDAEPERAFAPDRSGRRTTIGFRPTLPSVSPNRGGSPA